MITHEQMLKIANSDDPYPQYCELARELRKTLPSGRAVYQVFLDFSLTLPDDEDFLWEPMFSAMDCITGWCSQQSKIFPDEVV